MNSILKNKSMQKMQKMCSSKNMIVFLKYTLIIIFVLVSLNYIMNYLSAEPEYYQGPGSLIETLTSIELEKQVDDAIARAKSDGMSEQDVRGIFNEMKGQLKTGPSGPSEEEINRMIQAKINQYAVGVVDAVNELKPPEIETPSRGNDFRTPSWEGSDKHIHNPVINRLAMETPGRRILQDDAYDKALSMGGGDKDLRRRMKNDRFSFLNPSSSGYETTLSRFFTSMLPASKGSDIVDPLDPKKNDELNKQRRNFLGRIQGGMGLKPSSYLGGNPKSPRNPANRSIKHARMAIDTERKYLMHLGATKALQAHEAAHINAKKYNFYPYGPNTLGNYNKDHTDQRSERLAEATLRPLSDTAPLSNYKTTARNYGFGVLAPPGTDKNIGPHQVRYALSQSQIGDPYYLSKM